MCIYVLFYRREAASYRAVSQDCVFSYIDNENFHHNKKDILIDREREREREREMHNSIREKGRLIHR